MMVPVHQCLEIQPPYSLRRAFGVTPPAGLAALRAGGTYWIPAYQGNDEVLEPARATANRIPAHQGGNGFLPCLSPHPPWSTLFAPGFLRAKSLPKTLTHLSKNIMNPVVFLQLIRKSSCENVEYIFHNIK
jgi:hypothetical protein